MLFISLKNACCSQDIHFFLFLAFPLFLPVGHCFRVWLKINLKVLDIINCLNKSSITHFIWYLEREKRYDIETLSIDGVSDNVFIEKSCRNVQQKLVPDLFIILVSNPKQPLHAWNYFKSRIFWKRIIKKPWKRWLHFSAEPSPFQ